MTDKEKVECPRCDGEGLLHHVVQEWHEYGDTTVCEYLTESVECDRCEGTGLINPPLFYPLG